MSQENFVPQTQRLFVEHPAVVVRDRLVKERSYKLLRVFDTNEHEPDKDVCLVQDAQKKMILRVGEHRPVGFFPQGYDGKHIVIPRLYEHSQDPVFELEAYLPAPELVAVDPEISLAHIIRPDLQTKLIDGHWEIQEVFRTQPMPVFDDRVQKFEKHLASALTLLDTKEQQQVKEIFSRHTDFWQPVYPSKWKYADDNILLLEDGRLGLIDLKGVGYRFWGYDLGWIFWPRWLRLSVEQLAEISVYQKTLDAFFQEVYKRALEKEKQNKEQFFRHTQLLVLTRVIGAFYDMAERISHTQKLLKDKEKTQALMGFLRGLLKNSSQTLL